MVYLAAPSKWVKKIFVMHSNALNYSWFRMGIRWVHKLTGICAALCSVRILTFSQGKYIFLIRLSKTSVTFHFLPLKLRTTHLWCLSYNALNEECISF